MWGWQSGGTARSVGARADGGRGHWGVLRLHLLASLGLKRAHVLRDREHQQGILLVLLVNRLEPDAVVARLRLAVIDLREQDRIGDARRFGVRAAVESPHAGLAAALRPEVHAVHADRAHADRHGAPSSFGSGSGSSNRDG